ncbi:subtilisin-like protease SBT1.7 [Miscanthus floridulus]|uniref:subtilisin-like protease SBT1.7 n=1 Tax=Miscanthus floridulus TaxID=154761 RepID=UPI0034582380
MSTTLFGAVCAGVFVACSASNSSPDASSLSNMAPWTTTVGAATMDRVFLVSDMLENSQVLTGQSLYYVTANRTDFVRLLPSACTAKDLVPDRIMGKIIMCAGDLGADASCSAAV